MCSLTDDGYCAAQGTAAVLWIMQLSSSGLELDGAIPTQPEGGEPGKQLPAPASLGLPGAGPMAPPAFEKLPRPGVTPNQRPRGVPQRLKEPLPEGLNSNALPVGGQAAPWRTVGPAVVRQTC